MPKNVAKSGSAETKEVKNPGLSTLGPPRKIESITGPKPKEKFPKPKPRIPVTSKRG